MYPKTSIASIPAPVGSVIELWMGIMRLMGPSGGGMEPPP